MIFDRLAFDVVEDTYFKRLLLELNNDYSNYVIHKSNITSIKNKSLSDIYRFADILSNSEIEEHKNVSLKIMSHLQVFYEEDTTYNVYLNAILSKLGNFPAMNILKENTVLPIERGMEVAYKKFKQQIPTEQNQFYTDVQYKIINRIRNQKNFSFSGPTSMGKSYIIKDIIKYNLQKNMSIKCFVIIVPTKALINQIIAEFTEYLKRHNLKNNVNLYSHFDEALELAEKNIYILTPERLLSMINDKSSPIIDMIFVDEAHKLAAEKDTRSITLYLSIEKVVQKYPEVRLYFSSPNVSNPEVLLQTYNIDSGNTFTTSESPVNQNLFYLDLIDNKQLVWNPIDKIMEEIKTNVDINPSLEYHLSHIGIGYSNIVYSHSIDENIINAVKFKEYVSTNSVNSVKMDEEIEKLIDLIKDTLHSKCFLIECLKNEIAYHFSGLPQSIRLSIEDLFKRGKIKYLFCTATLLEGVNLPAKNIFILQNKKGLSNMTEMDFWNLAGRAGRLSFELGGNVICLRSDERHWTSISLLSKKELTIQPIITQKTQRNIKKIKNLIKNGPKKNNDADTKILNYITNVISIDGKNSGQSVLIDKLKEKVPEIFEIIDMRFGNSKLPDVILSKSYLIGIDQQEEAYKVILNEIDEINELFNEINYRNCLYILNKLFEIYDWEKYEKELSKKNRLKYYAFLMNQWMNGVTLNKIIKDAIDYKVNNNQRIFKYNQPTDEYYNANNPSHINMVIKEVLSDIENVIQYSIQIYLENFQNILEYFNKSDQNNWLKYLEYGTNDKCEIALQNLGLSRAAAKFLVVNYGAKVIKEQGDTIEINLDLLEKIIDKTNPYSKEILNILI